MQTLDVRSLTEFTLQIFQAAGFGEADAKRATDVLIWASLRGVDTHGIRNLKRYYIDSSGVGRRDGTVIENAPLTTEKESPTTAALNANGGLGLSVSVRSMDLTIAKAREHGVAVVTVRNSTHFGAAGYYADMAAQENMLGFASTGYFFAHGQPKCVVPFGGLIPMLSTNPLAMACPGVTFPFLMDLSTSVVPVNRVEMLEERGQPIPAGWSLDQNHQTTADPAAVEKMEPLGGATTYGGHKGYALALGSWILTGLLSGAWRGDPEAHRILGSQPETKNGFAQEGIGHIFAAVRLDHFGDPEFFKRGLASMMQTLGESPAADGFDKVRVPGEKEHETLQVRQEQGIPVSPATFTDLRSLSEQFHVPLPESQTSDTL